MGGTERKEGTKKEIRNTGREVLQKTRRENVKRDEKWSTAPQASPEERLQAWVFLRDRDPVITATSEKGDREQARC